MASPFGIGASASAQQFTATPISQPSSDSGATAAMGTQAPSIPMGIAAGRFGNVQQQMAWTADTARTGITGKNKSGYYDIGDSQQYQPVEVR